MGRPRFRNAQRLEVSVGASTEAGALEPVLDSGDLVLESPIADDLNFAFGINVDAVLVFDVDRSGVVGSIEALVPAELWDRLHHGVEPPTTPPSGVLVFLPQATETVIDDADVQFIYDERKGARLIEIEPISSQSTWIALSECCHAILNTSFLAGLYCIIPSSVVDPLHR